MIAAVQSLRPEHWIKNVLILAPLLLAHRIAERELVITGFLAVFSFCLAASSVYLINDILDRGVDSEHPLKKHRPLASGRLQVRTALGIAPLLVLFALASAYFLVSAKFVLCIAAYLIVGNLYSLWLKRVLLVDVFLLTSLYVLRVVSGGVALEIEISPWLMALIIFLFVSLAFSKRYAELSSLDGDADRMAGRGYRKDELPLIESLGSASGYLSVLVLALYISSDQVAALYARPALLWPVCLLLMFWISSIWFSTRRGLLTDPVTHLFKDPVSYLVAAGTLALGVAAAI